MLFDIFGKTHLILVLDIHELMLRLLVVCVDRQPFHSGQIRNPLVSYMSRHPFRQKRIAMKQEASLGNSVSFVVEFLRHHLVEILQLLILQNLRVKPCYTIDRIAGSDGQMSHLHLAVHDDGHLLHFVIIVRIFLLDLNNKSPVDLFYDLVNTRKQSGEQLNGPFFQCLGHDRMVGISTRLCGHFPCCIPVQSMLIHQHTHQLCHCYCRMGIVQLERCLLIELADICMRTHIALHCCLHACRHEEILLF